MKKRSLTHKEKAIARIVALIKDGIIVKSDAIRGNYTIGPWTPAVGPRGRFAVYGYRVDYDEMGSLVGYVNENLSAVDAAEILVARVGAGRARDAAIAADKKRGRGVARVEMDKNGNAVVVYDWTHTVRVGGDGSVVRGMDGKPPRRNPCGGRR